MCERKFKTNFFKKFFTSDDLLVKQIDGYTMGGPLSVTISDIYMIKMEEDMVKPAKPDSIGIL